LVVLPNCPLVLQVMIARFLRSSSRKKEVPLDFMFSILKLWKFAKVMEFLNFELSVMALFMLVCTGVMVILMR
jgi:hypothetical protein